jgi:hypothetical protein
MGGGDIALLRELDPIDIFDTRDRIDPWSEEARFLWSFYHQRPIQCQYTFGLSRPKEWYCQASFIFSALPLLEGNGRGPLTPPNDAPPILPPLVLPCWWPWPCPFLISLLILNESLSSPSISYNLLFVESPRPFCCEGGIIVGTLIGGRGDIGRLSYEGPAWVCNSAESFDFLLRREKIVEREEVLIPSIDLCRRRCRLRVAPLGIQEVYPQSPSIVCDPNWIFDEDVSVMFHKVDGRWPGILSPSLFETLLYFSSSFQGVGSPLGRLAHSVTSCGGCFNVESTTENPKKGFSIIT